MVDDGSDVMDDDEDDDDIFIEFSEDSDDEFNLEDVLFVSYKF